MNKTTILIGCVFLLMVNVCAGDKFEKYLVSYNPLNIYETLMAECESCVLGNENQNYNNRTVFVFHNNVQKIACSDFVSYYEDTITNPVPDPYDAYVANSGKCNSIVTYIVEEQAVNHFGEDILQTTAQTIDKKGIAGFLWETVKGIFTYICFGDFCLDFFFNIAETLFSVFSFMFNLMLFILNNLYLFLVIAEIFIMLAVIQTVGGMYRKIQVFCSHNHSLFQYIWKFVTGMIHLFISFLNLIRSMIPLI